MAGRPSCPQHVDPHSGPWLAPTPVGPWGGTVPRGLPPQGLVWRLAHAQRVDKGRRATPPAPERSPTSQTGAGAQEATAQWGIPDPTVRPSCRRTSWGRRPQGRGP